jgi:hypothetical protein
MTASPKVVVGVLFLSTKLDRNIQCRRTWLMFASAPAAAPVSQRARTRAPGAVFCEFLKLRWLLPAAAAATIMSATLNVALAQGTWSTSHLTVARFGLAATSSGNFAVFAGGTTPESSLLMSNAVDLYNSETGTWSTASLSVARAYLAAASAGNMAIFAGGLLAAGASLLILEGHGLQLHVFCFLSNVDLLRDHFKYQLAASSNG